MLQIVEYKRVSEIGRTHPEVKSLSVVYQIPRGMGIESIRAQLMKRNIKERVFRVGNFIWKPAQTTERLYACFEKVGDNPGCSRHGDIT